MDDQDLAYRLSVRLLYMYIKCLDIGMIWRHWDFIESDDGGENILGTLESIYQDRDTDLPDIIDKLNYQLRCHRKTLNRHYAMCRKLSYKCYIEAEKLQLSDATDFFSVLTDYFELFY